jgi:hypothetical protein
MAVDDVPRTTPLPTTQLFAPLRADPKEPRFFVSALQVDSALRDTTLGAVGFGEHFGLVRRETGNGEGWQLGIAGAVFAQFDLEAASSDLINADYVIGLPLTWRRGDWSGRLRLYHQSSHLGDEFLLSTQPQRVNLSFEAIEAIVAYDFGNLRLYGGGETLFDRDPADLGQTLLHAGLDWRGREVAFRLGDLGGARWVAGLDMKRWQQNDWAAQISAKAGLEFAPLAEGSGRRWNACWSTTTASRRMASFIHRTCATGASPSSWACEKPCIDPTPSHSEEQDHETLPFHRIRLEHGDHPAGTWCSGAGRSRTRPAPRPARHHAGPGSAHADRHPGDCARGLGAGRKDRAPDRRASPAAFDGKDPHPGIRRHGHGQVQKP